MVIEKAFELSIPGPLVQHMAYGLGDLESSIYWRYAIFEPVKSDILAAGVQDHYQLTQKGKKGTIQSFLMMMKWLRVEHSPIVVILVVST